jgi:hypothetical protein
MSAKITVIELFALAALFLLIGIASADSNSNLVGYSDDRNGFSFQYPSYWTLEKSVDQMISIQDGTIDLIRQEDLSLSERESYKAMVHVAGSPRYVSNVVFMVHPNSGTTYGTSEDAVQSLKRDFEDTMASGTFFLEETYLGESHAFVYQRNVNVPQWHDSAQITYYLAASTSRAYMMVETVLASQLADSVNSDQFNQVVQSFRVTANESTPIDPSLDWGAAKPGTPTENLNLGTEVGQVEIHEYFDNNEFHWPSGDNAKIKNGQYELNSVNSYPFTVRNTGLGQISFDFSYQGDATFLDGSESAGYGLVFGYTDENNYYAFLVTAGGQFMVGRERDGQVTNLVPWTSTEFLQGPTHTLFVQGDYQTLNEAGPANRYVIIFYIDGHQVCETEINDVLAVSGWFGLFVSKDLDVEFDNLISRNFLVDAVMSLQRIVH